MLNEMTLLCLLILVVAHLFLVRGCFKIQPTINDSTVQISGHFETISHLINELCDIIAELTPASQNSTIQKQAAGGSIAEMLSSLLINRMNMGQEHGPQESERTIHEIDPNTTQEQTETISQ